MHASPGLLWWCTGQPSNCMLPHVYKKLHLLGLPLSSPSLEGPRALFFFTLEEVEPFFFLSLGRGRLTFLFLHLSRVEQRSHSFSLTGNRRLKPVPFPPLPLCLLY